MLIDGVDVEDQYQRRQTAGPFPEVIPIALIALLVGECQEDNTRGQGQRYGYSENPQPPLPPLDLVRTQLFLSLFET